MPKTTHSLRAEKAFDDEKYFSESGDEDDVDDLDEGEDDEDIAMQAAQDDDEEDAEEGDSEVYDQSSAIQNTLRTVDFGTLADAQASLARDRQHIHPSRFDTSSNLNSAPSSRTDAEKVNTIRDRLAELKSLKSTGGLSLIHI